MVRIEVSPDAIVERVLSAGHPDKIVLFGSQARNSAQARSDSTAPREGKTRYEKQG